jgi:low temperature requirement protein LtrA
MLLVMGGMLTAALAIPEAFGDNAVLVAGAIAFVRIMQVVLFGIAARKMPGMFMAVLRFVPSAMGAPMLIVVGAVTEIGPLEAWWAGALAFELVAMLVMGLSGWTVSPGHFSERHGLIFIIALGEAVISIGIGASHLKLDASVLVPALLGLGVIVAMWWAYFDVNALAAERRLSSTKGIAQVALAQHAYSYLHLPMIIGLIFFSLGVEMTLAHTGEVLGTIPAFALCGGLTMFLAAQIGFRLRSGGSLSIPRVVAVVALVAIFALSGLFTALFVLTSVAACFAVLIAYETVGEREERLRIRSSEHASWA